MKRTLTPLMTLVLLIYAFALAQAASVEEVGNYVKAEIAKRHIPGVSVAVVRDGKVVLAEGYGLADIERNVPATKDTVYEIGSMTKQFTATAIMLLAREDKLSLDDKVSQYLSDLPETWKAITIRHLLTHTSGIKGYTEVGDFMTLARNDHTHEEIIKRVSGLPLDFQPGEKWAYSNTGYYLLGMIIEKVSGKPYEEFLMERIFKPLGMSCTRDGDPSVIIPNRAAGYIWDGTTYHNGELLHPSAAFSAGFLISTVLDLAKWDAALYTDKPLKQAELQQMWTSAKLKDGKETGYGFGWAIGKQNGHKLIEHGGGTAAFASIISRYVDDKLTVIVLTNRTGADAGGLAHGIAGLYIPALKQPVEVPIADKDPATTQKLKEILDHAAKGTLDPNVFTSEARAELFPDRAKEAATFLGQLGPLKSFTLIGQRNAGQNHMSRYRAVYQGMTLNITYVLTPDGKIAGMGVSPE